MATTTAVRPSVRPAARSGPLPHLTPDERAARGKAARAEVPRSRHAEYAPQKGRPDPVALLEEQARDREPDLVPIRYGRMLVSPFTFYRGAALIMASDLSRTPVSGLKVQLCGDAHLSNFGAFASPERRLVFDINDFDETLPGPWEWDVKRLAVSFAVAEREKGQSAESVREVVMRCVRGYREAMAEFAEMPNLAVWYAHMDIEAAIAQVRAQVDPRLVKRADKNIAKARSRDSMQAFSKLAHVVDGEPRITSDPPLVVPIRELVHIGPGVDVMAELANLFRQYRRTLPTDRRVLLEQFRFVDLARKVVGVGSVGTRAWIALFLGRDGDDPLFLQAKEAPPSVLERFLPASEYANCGHRVVAGQRLMQATSDIFLGWQRVAKGLDGRQRDFYIRQLRDWKGSAEVDAMLPEAMLIYARLCGWTLARAHARSGDRIAIAAYLGSGQSFDRALADFADAYADQNEADYAALQEAVASGRVTAQAGL